MNFADAFNQSFLRSRDMYARQQEADRQFELQKQSHAAEMKERGLRTQALQRVNDAQEALTVAGTKGMQTAPAMRQEFQDNRDVGLPGEAAVTPAQYRPSSERELLGLRRNLAYATGSEANIAAVGAASKQLDWDEGYKARSAEWDALPLEQRAKLFADLSYDKSIPGAFSMEAKKGKDGRYHYMVPGKGPVTFNESEMRHLYSLHGMAQVDPGRAFDEARKVLKGKADEAIAIFQMNNEATKTNNQAANFENTDQYHKAQLGIAQTKARQDIWQFERLRALQELGGKAMTVNERLQEAKRSGNVEAAQRAADELSSLNMKARVYGVNLLDKGNNFDPVRYSETFKNLAAGGMDTRVAQEQADTLWGRGPDYEAMGAGIAAVVAAKRKAEAEAMRKDKASYGPAPAAPAQSQPTAPAAPAARGLDYGRVYGAPMPNWEYPAAPPAAAPQPPRHGSFPGRYTPNNNQQ